MKCKLSIREIIHVIGKSIEAGEITLDSAIYVSTEPCNSNDKCIESAKPICSVCSCKDSKTLVLLIGK